MKKFSFISATVVMAVAVVLFVSCQKEQAAVPVPVENNAVAGSEGAVVGVAGSGSFAGSIPSDYAAALAANYAKRYGNDGKQSQSVAFSAKDLIAFIQGLQTKYKSDQIYVNFGVYGKGASPVNGKDWGKMTVFFTGNKITGSSSSSDNRKDGLLGLPLPLDLDLNLFLNHGQIFP